MVTAVMLTNAKAIARAEAKSAVQDSCRLAQSTISSASAAPITFRDETAITSGLASGYGNVMVRGREGS